MGCVSSKGDGGAGGGKKKGENLVLNRFKLMPDTNLGEGSFSKVQKGIDTETGNEVAIKTYKLEAIYGNHEEMMSVLKKYKRQIRVLQDLAADFKEPNVNPRLHHPMFMKIATKKLFLELLGYSTDQNDQPGQGPDGEMYVVTEIADYSMKDYLEARREQNLDIDPDMIAVIAKNFVLAVSVLHAKGYVHLDIKPENIMRANGVWKLIDVDGCIPLTTKISIDDSTISFSPCYCAPEWAHFLLSETGFLEAKDGLDVWSVGLSLCELIVLDAVLKPKYAQIFRQVGSHRKAGFLFLEWLSNPKEKLQLDNKCLHWNADFANLVLGHMTRKQPADRKTLAECLEHVYLKDIIIPGVEDDLSGKDVEKKFAAKNGSVVELAKKKHNDRKTDKDRDRAPLYKGVLFKLDSDGDKDNKEHWRKRDMWLSAGGNMCYFSQKKGERLVLLDAGQIAQMRISKLPKDFGAQECAFVMEFGKKDDDDDDEDANVDMDREGHVDTQTFGAENEETLNKWIKYLKMVHAHEHEGIDNIVFDGELKQDFANFRIEIRNRREKLTDQEKGGEVLKCELYKLNTEGDMLNEEHWLKREMWIAKNGALCYYSKKEERDVQYYRAEDIRTVTFANVPDSDSFHPHTFTLQLKSCDGLEYAPGVFAAMDAAGQQKFLEVVKSFQGAQKAGKKAGKSIAAAAGDKIDSRKSR